MAEDCIDQVARDNSTKALFLLEAHERECKLRADATLASFKAGSARMAELKLGQDRIFSLIIAGGVLTISTLAGATWWLTVTLAGAVAKANGIELP